MKVLHNRILQSENIDAPPPAQGETLPMPSWNTQSVLPNFLESLNCHANLATTKDQRIDRATDVGFRCNSALSLFVCVESSLRRVDESYEACASAPLVGRQRGIQLALHLQELHTCAFVHRRLTLSGPVTRLVVRDWREGGSWLGGRRGVFSHGAPHRYQERQHDRDEKEVASRRPSF